MRIKCFLLVILIFIMISSVAQEAIIPAGSNGSGSGGSVAYSLGQILYTNSGGESDQLFHGVQQPYEISIVLGLERFKEIRLTLSSYPNPVSDFLNLKVESLKWEDLKFQMYNSEGKILLSDKLLNAETNIDVSQLAPGMYFLTVSLEDTPVKTFKIIKK